MQKTTIGLASDHAGFAYKTHVRNYLKEQGYLVRDFGTGSDVSCDYPDFIGPLAREISDAKLARGIIFGGSGNGEAMCANRYIGVRAAVCWTEETARLATEHNNANIISIGERMVSKELTIKMIDAWLGSTFEGGRHEQRIAKLDRTDAS